MRAPDDLDAFLAQVSDPASPYYQQYLTPDQFTDQFGPSTDDYQTLIDYCQAHGFTIAGTHSNRTILDVSATVAQIESAFQINLMVYQHPTRGRFFAPNREPVLDVSLNIQDISGLDNFVIPHPMNLQTRSLAQGVPYVTGSGPAGLFTGKDFRAAYAPSVVLTGAGQSVGLFELDGFYAADVAANFKQAGLTAVPTQTVLVDGFKGSAGSDNAEVTLDIMMAAYMAPGLSKIIVYEGTNPNDVLNRMATDNTAKQLSCSWGFSPTNATTEQIFKQYIAQGQSFFVASGDSGAYKGSIMPPSDDPNVTSVGGTSLTTSGSGGPWLSETTWSGSGGGVSTTWPIPTYQQSLSMAANKGSSTMRNIPDVSLTADIQLFLIQSNGQAVEIGGTSAAAPLWAGFIALANQQAAANNKAAIGFLNTPLYALGKTSSYSSNLHDIATGNDGGFSAVSGYDLATGWGTPSGQGLINSLTGISGTPSFNLTSSATSIAIHSGTPGTATIAVNPLSGFNSAVAFTIAGLPTGVTAAFSPASSTSASTLTLTAGTAAVAGTTTVTVTGASGTLKSTVSISVVVTTPSFTLTLPSSAISMTASSATTATVTVVPAGGFTGNVTLAAAGLPAGVTAAFGTNPTSKTSVLTLTATAAAVANGTTVTITGTSGTLTASTTFALTVTQPDFSLSLAGTTWVVTQGGTISGNLTVTPLNRFAGAVALSASNLPTGVTAAFSPTSATLTQSTGTAAATPATSLFTFTATGAATLGAVTVTLTGKSGTLTHSITLSLNVAASISGSVLVSPQTSYNVIGIYPDATKFSTSGGLDAAGRAYSASLLSSAQVYNGTAFELGAAGASDGISGKTVTLPTGQYSTLKLLATGVNGSQAAQVFTVTYSDGSTTSFTQSLSDWVTSSAFPGESIAVSMPYRNNSDGTRDVRTVHLYCYSFTLNAAKTIASVTLPTTRNVVVMAATLLHGAALAVPAQVSLASAFDTTAIVTDGSTFTGGADGVGHAFSSKLLATSQSFNNTLFNLGAANASNVVKTANKAISLTAGKFSAIALLATAVQGAQTAQTFKVAYSDGTSTSFTQSLSDWATPQAFSGEWTAVSMPYRDTAAGKTDTTPVFLYAYVFALNSAKTVTSITTPNNANVRLYAVTLVP